MRHHLDLFCPVMTHVTKADFRKLNVLSICHEDTRYIEIDIITTKNTPVVLNVDLNDLPPEFFKSKE